MEIEANTGAEGGGFASKTACVGLILAPLLFGFCSLHCLLGTKLLFCMCRHRVGGGNLLPRKNTGQTCKKEGNCKIQNPSIEASSSDHAQHVMGFFREITHNGLRVWGDATVPRHNFTFRCLSVVATCCFVFQMGTTTQYMRVPQWLQCTSRMLPHIAHLMCV